MRPPWRPANAAALLAPGMRGLIMLGYINPS
jgi:hypothetical protein